MFLIIISKDRLLPNFKKEYLESFKFKFVNKVIYIFLNSKLIKKN